MSFIPLHISCPTQLILPWHTHKLLSICQKWVQLLLKPSLVQKGCFPQKAPLQPSSPARSLKPCWGHRFPAHLTRRGPLLLLHRLTFLVQHSSPQQVWRMHCLGLDRKHRAKRDFSTPGIRVGVLKGNLWCHCPSRNGICIPLHAAQGKSSQMPPFQLGHSTERDFPSFAGVAMLLGRVGKAQ